MTDDHQGGSSESRVAKVRRLLGRIAHDIDQRLPTGDVAELRRMRFEDPSCPAFWKLMVGVVEPELDLPARGRRRLLLERRWAAILAGAANLEGLHVPRRPLGKALADADVAEMRVSRLLRAHDDALLDVVRMICHQLRSAAVSVDQSDIAMLVLSDGERDEEVVRRQIARDYFSTQLGRDAS